VTDDRCKFKQPSTEVPTYERYLSSVTPHLTRVLAAPSLVAQSCIRTPTQQVNMDDRDEEYTGPEDWRRHKPYGSGISQRRINFIKAGSAPPKSEEAATTFTTSTDVSSLYLNLVLKRPKTTPGTPASVTNTTPTTAATRTGFAGGVALTAITKRKGWDEEEIAITKDTHPVQICETCSLYIHDSETHHLTLAHQLSLPHSELPHHFDRSSQGLKYLVSRGWDPDKKVGLGKEGTEGDMVPMALKLKPKHDTMGLGLKVKDKDKRKAKGPGSGKVVKKLDAKGARKEAEKERERRKALTEYLNRS